jgi:chromosome segregation ATPase
METNGTTLVAEPPLDAVSLRSPAAAALDSAGTLALAPLVDKIAYGIAKGLVLAMKELEEHITSETRKVGDAVDRRLVSVQSSLHDLTGFVGEQRTINTTVQEQIQQLTAADAGLQETDAKHAADLAVVQSETRTLAQSLTQQIEGLCKELGIQQEDMVAVKNTLTSFSSRVDGLAERLDRQAEAVRSMYTAYSQRETELEQLVDGLARLRAFPTPLPANSL